MTSTVRSSHEPKQRILDQPLRVAVERAGGFVEDQNRRVPEQCPGNRDPLPLATREPRTPLAQTGVVAVRQLGDEAVGVGGAGRRFDLGLSGVGPAERDVGETPCR